MTDDDLIRLLRDADPAPDRLAVDAVALARIRERVGRELTTMQRDSRRPAVLRLAPALALVLLAVALGLTRFTGDDGSTAAGGGVALGGGGAISSCIAFSEEELARAPIAFDGTVTSIDGPEVTLAVTRWYRGGEGGTVTVHAPDLADAEALVGAVGFEVGRRYLVSAFESEGKIVPSVCGFSVTYDEGMADTFAQAFA